MNIQQYWAAVNQAEIGLPDAPVYYLTSLTTPDGGKAGVVLDIATKRQAAVLMVGAIARASTPAEIEQFHVNQKLAAEEYSQIEMKRKQQFAMPTEMTALLAALAADRSDKKKEKP